MNIDSKHKAFALIIQTYFGKIYIYPFFYKKSYIIFNFKKHYYLFSECNFLHYN